MVTPETPTEPERVTEPVEVPKPEPTVTWRDNPNNCDLSTQYIREDNLQCKDKPQPKTVSEQATSNASPSGTKEQWMAAAGIPQDQWWAVDYIVSRESGWNPCAYNPGRSNCGLTDTQIDALCATYVRHNGRSICGSACGLAQSLPCQKQGSDWSDPVASLKWQYNYVKSRYGGYVGAYNHWVTNHWY